MITKEEEWGALEKLSKAREQLTEILQYEKVHAVIAKKDIKKGEIIKVRCRVDVPKEIYDEIVADVIQNVGRKMVIPR